MLSPGLLLSSVPMLFADYVSTINHSAWLLVNFPSIQLLGHVLEILRPSYLAYCLRLSTLSKALITVVVILDIQAELDPSSAQDANLKSSFLLPRSFDSCR